MIILCRNNAQGMIIIEGSSIDPHMSTLDIEIKSSRSTISKLLSSYVHTGYRDQEFKINNIQVTISDLVSDLFTYR